MSANNFLNYVGRGIGVFIIAIGAVALLTGCQATGGSETTGCFVNGVYMEVSYEDDPEPVGSIYSYTCDDFMNFVKENPDYTSIYNAVDGSYVVDGVVYTADDNIYEGE